MRKLYTKWQNTNYTVDVNNYPDKCGICHKNVDPSFISSVFVQGDNTSHFIEASFQCTNSECNSIIIGYYKKVVNNSFELFKTAPVIPEDRVFNKEIVNLSNNFVAIYNQSFFAEQNSLELISGIGYRKALEFLVKDYLISLTPDETDKILTMPLGQCINKLENENIREIAKRAVWIGNDEAHYVRKWENKDISDLKKLIDITVYFISMEISSRKYLEEMTKS